MKVEEVKINDWIGFHNPTTGEDEVGKIDEINGNYVKCGSFNIKLSDAYPIKLTEEILQKNNFEHYKDSKDDYWCTKRGEIIIEYDWDGTFVLGMSMVDVLSDSSLKYVHELQHLMWALKIDDKNFKINPIHPISEDRLMDNGWKFVEDKKYFLTGKINGKNVILEGNIRYSTYNDIYLALTLIESNSIRMYIGIANDLMELNEYIKLLNFEEII